MDTFRFSPVLLVPLLLIAGCGGDTDAVAPVGAATAAEPLASPKAADDFTAKASYAVGYDFGSSLKAQGASLDAQRAARGLVDGLEGWDPQLKADELAALLTQFGAEMSKKAGQRFLAENKKQQRIQVTESGLQYEVLKKGTGPIPKKTDRVRVHYRGTLISGAVFDSSYDRNEPGEFPVGGVIDGWTEALQLMRVGSKWLLFIPSELGYAEQGSRDGAIGPNEVLIFEVELLDILTQ